MRAIAFTDLFSTGVARGDIIDSPMRVFVCPACGEGGRGSIHAAKIIIDEVSKETGRKLLTGDGIT